MEEEERNKMGKSRKGLKIIKKMGRKQIWKERRGMGNVHNCSYIEVTERWRG
jgi:hypothetical protein